MARPLPQPGQQLQVRENGMVLQGDCWNYPGDKPVLEHQVSNVAFAADLSGLLGDEKDLLAAVTKDEACGLLPSQRSLQHFHSQQLSKAKQQFSCSEVTAQSLQPAQPGVRMQFNITANSSTTSTSTASCQLGMAPAAFHPLQSTVNSLPVPAADCQAFQDMVDRLDFDDLCEPVSPLNTGSTLKLYEALFLDDGEAGSSGSESPECRLDHHMLHPFPADFEFGDGSARDAAPCFPPASVSPNSPLDFDASMHATDHSFHFHSLPQQQHRYSQPAMLPASLPLYGQSYGLQRQHTFSQAEFSHQATQVYEQSGPMQPVHFFLDSAQADQLGQQVQAQQKRAAFVAAAGQDAYPPFPHIQESHQQVRLEIKGRRSASPVRKPRRPGAGVGAHASPSKSPAKPRTFSVGLGGLHQPPFPIAAPSLQQQAAALPSSAASSGRDEAGAPSNSSQVSCSDTTEADSATTTTSSEGGFPLDLLNIKGKHGGVRKVCGKKPKRQTCVNCSTHQTPQWRCGPTGPRTLCNACGVRYKKGLSLNGWPGFIALAEAERKRQEAARQLAEGAVSGGEQPLDGGAMPLPQEEPIMQHAAAPIAMDVHQA